MSGSFDTLSTSAKIAFWQNIELKIKEALRQCESQLPIGVIKEVSDYLEHNELGLAWETLGSELTMMQVAPPEVAGQMMLETGACMGFDQPGARSCALWRDLETLLNRGG
jgi:hypothetical protein